MKIFLLIKLRDEEKIVKFTFFIKCHYNYTKFDTNETIYLFFSIFIINTKYNLKYI